MKEDEKDSDRIVVRLMEERDVKGVLEVLATEEFWSRAEGFPHEFERRYIAQARKVKEKGFDKYSNALVAATEEKAVARLLMDTNYPPYSELANVKVHPDYRGKGIGTRLVRRFVELAQEHGCNVLYVITKKRDPQVQRFYSRLGFKPAMLHGFQRDEKEIVLFRFLDGTIQNEFVRSHPPSAFSASGSPVKFHEQSAYQMAWKDSLSESYLACYLKGKRHLSMPRIAGVLIKENDIACEAWIEEVTGKINLEHEGKFRIFLANRNVDPLTVRIGYILPEESALTAASVAEEITLEGMGETCLEAHLRIGPRFRVPQLSFRTVLVTCTIRLGKFRSPIHISAGFEGEPFRHK